VPVYQIDPLTDRRWQDLTERHPRASVFHSSGWLRALQLTYGYEPIAYTLSSPGSELTNAVVFSRIRSWATGRKLVSLPFSDHCEPLVDRNEDAAEILSQVSREASKSGYRFVEIRPQSSTREERRGDAGFGISDSFILHQVDVRPSLDQLFRSFHKDCVQRKIRRAEKERLEYREGRSDELVDMFFELMLQTRRKHAVPPQPIQWFRNLANCLGGHLQIRVALAGNIPAASIVTLKWSDTLVYKYGCSNSEFSNLGGTPLLFWKAIQAAKADNLSWFDLGRSDIDNEGLLAFKDHWGGHRSTLSYWRSPAPRSVSSSNWGQRVGGHVVKRMPDSLLALAGRLLYKHIG
jgi:hypothetical protein